MILALLDCACTNPIGANKGYASETIVFISKTLLVQQNVGLMPTSYKPTRPTNNAQLAASSSSTSSKQINVIKI